jgi:hypothetical protein
MISNRNTQALSRIMRRANQRAETEDHTGTISMEVDGIEVEVVVTVEVSFENGPDGRTWSVEDWSAETADGTEVEVSHEVALSIASDNV